MGKIKQKGVEKRKFQRLEIPLDIIVKVITAEEVLGEAKAINLKTHDISLEGISLEARDIVVNNVNILSGSPGARENMLDMQIVLDPEEEPVKAVGEVCWYDIMRGSEEFMYQIGVVFVKMEDRDRQQLKNFLKDKAPAPGFFKRIFG